MNEVGLGCVKTYVLELSWGDMPFGYTVHHIFSLRGRLRTHIHDISSGVWA